MALPMEIAGQQVRSGQNATILVTSDSESGGGLYNVSLSLAYLFCDCSFAGSMEKWTDIWA